MTRMVEWVYERAWAIIPEALETIIAVVERWNNERAGGGVHAALEEGAFKTAGAVQSRGMNQLPGTMRVFIRDNTAIIPIVGPIFPRANFLTNICGATSAETFAADFSVALRDPSVERIVFDIDSPGGQVTQVSEVSQLIYDARGEKPLVAFVSGMMASAAYWIGSAADQIITSDTGIIGSIGVIAAVRDETEREIRDGIRRHTFVSSVSPNKIDTVTSDDGRRRIQALVDSQGQIFVAAVARNRGTDMETVLANYGQGGVFVGAEAVAQGLADAVGTFEGLFSEENNIQYQQRRERGMDVKSKNDGTGAEYTITVEALRETSPETYEAIFERGVNAGMERGAEMERERLRSIDALRAPGFESLISEYKYKPEMTAEKLAKIILDTQAERQSAAATANRADAERLGTVAVAIDQGGHSDEEAARAEQDAAIAAIAAGAEEYRPRSGVGASVSVTVPRTAE